MSFLRKIGKTITIGLLLDMISWPVGNLRLKYWRDVKKTVLLAANTSFYRQVLNARKENLAFHTNRYLPLFIGDITVVLIFLQYLVHCLRNQYLFVPRDDEI